MHGRDFNWRGREVLRRHQPTGVFGRDLTLALLLASACPACQICSMRKKATPSSILAGASLLLSLVWCGGTGSATSGGDTDGAPRVDARRDDSGGDATGDSHPRGDSEGPEDVKPILPAACASCLKAMCAAYTMCTDQSGCEAILECLDACVAGSDTQSCALACIDAADAGAQGFAVDTIVCAQGECIDPCASSIGGFAASSDGDITD